MKKLLIFASIFASATVLASGDHDMKHDAESMKNSMEKPMATMMSAHQLMESIPFDNEMMMGSPEKIMLNFDAPVQLSELTLTSDEGVVVDIAFEANEHKKMMFEHDINELDMGSYTAAYTILNAKGDTETGSIWFMVH
jgi:methionine-rich copper-binding protein CopC